MLLLFEKHSIEKKWSNFALPSLPPTWLEGVDVGLAAGKKRWCNLAQGDKCRRE